MRPARAQMGMRLVPGRKWRLLSRPESARPALGSVLYQTLTQSWRGGEVLGAGSFEWPLGRTAPPRTRAGSDLRISRAPTDRKGSRMRRILVLLLLCTGVVAAAPSAFAQDMVCNGSFGAATVGSLTVPPNGACSLSGTKVNGNITVQANATLTAED